MFNAHESDGDKTKRPFSLWFFVITLVSSVSFLFFVLSLFLYQFTPSVLLAQINSGWLSITIGFLAAHLFCSFAEYIFHRYVLHYPLIPGLSYFYKSHTKHHALTHVVLRKSKNVLPEEATPNLGIVENFYPILEEKQHESSFFPWYSFFAFALVGSFVFVPVQILLPKAPVLLCGYLAIAWSLFLYETLHAVEHWSLEKWRPLLDHPRFGAFWRKVYGFHLRHHADIRSNESISGFFGIPIPDLLFGTWVSPQTLYTHGKPGERIMFEPRPARIPIRWLDKIAEWKENRKKERQIEFHASRTSRLAK